MRTLTAREILKKEYGSSRNFMTPHRVRVGKISRTIAFELSNGSGFCDHATIWGVSFAEIKENGETVRRSDISGVFTRRGEALAYIEEIRERERGVLSSSPGLEVKGETAEATARV